MKVKVKVKAAPKKPEAEEIEITSEFIKLDAFLKFSGLTDTGGEAKMLIQDENIKINGEICTQRGKKLRTGDIIEGNGRRFVIVSGGEA